MPACAPSGKALVTEPASRRTCPLIRKLGRRRLGTLPPWQPRISRSMGAWLSGSRALPYSERCRGRLPVKGPLRRGPESPARVGDISHSAPRKVKFGERLDALCDGGSSELGEDQPRQARAARGPPDRGGLALHVQRHQRRDHEPRRLRLAAHRHGARARRSPDAPRSAAGDRGERDHPGGSRPVERPRDHQARAGPGRLRRHGAVDRRPCGRGGRRAREQVSPRRDPRYRRQPPRRRLRTTRAGILEAGERRDPGRRSRSRPGPRSTRSTRSCECREST